MKTTLLALACGLLCAATVFAKEPFERNYSVRVDVDAGGAVTAAQVHGEAPDALVETLLDAARRAEFEPATKAGMPVPSRTTIQVRLRFEPEGDDLRARVTLLTGAGAWDRMTPPRYPSDALRRRESALVTARVVYDAAGRFDPQRSGVERVQRGGKRGVAGDDGGPFEKSFRAATLEVIRQWRYLPDEVDGQPIAAEFLVPVTFCAGSGGCEELRDTAQGPEPTPQAAPLDDSVRLASVRSTGAAMGAQY
jgi:TonB family protein